MVFSSITFLFFFLPFTIFFSFLCTSIKSKNIFLLVMSLIFYAWGEPVYVFLMIFSILINYRLAFFVADINNKYRKYFLALCIVLNFSLLFYFKYLVLALRIAGFVLKRISLPFNLSYILSNTFSNITVPPLPIGISFYTFQVVSYIVDVYRKPSYLQKNVFSVGLYISFFPQLIAGPIVRYHDIMAQIDERNVTLQKFCEGVERFIIGLSKKIFLANTLAAYADAVLNLEFAQYTAKYAWISMLAYMMQIYYDFSGYSDMAIGLGKIFGFSFSENFNYPYVATSLTDFWRRWHVSLSSWFKEYLYIPLGGNRKGIMRTYINLFIVFFVTGLWHGASFNFIIWGLGHGLLLVVEKWCKKINFFKKDKVWKKIAARIYTLGSVYFLWIFFRLGTKDAVKIILTMFGINYTIWTGQLLQIKTPIHLVLFYNYKAIIVFAAGILFTFPWWRKIMPCIENILGKKLYMIVKYFFLAVLLICSISCMMSGTYNPFIYFRF